MISRTLQESYIKELKSSQIFGVESYIQEIDAWATTISPFKTRPLLITGPIGCGKSSLVIKWIDYHTYSYKVLVIQQNNSNILIHISKISEADSVYYFSLYRVYTKIKETYSMSEKVRITEDALRINFIQWISKAIEKKKEKSIKAGNLVIIIDGVDKYLNSNGKEESPDWLLNEFPPSVKIIFTCCKGSRAFEHLVAKSEIVIEIMPFNESQKVNLYWNTYRQFQMYEKFAKLEEDIESSEKCGNPLFLKTVVGFYFTCFKHGRKFRYQNLDSFTSISHLINYIIDYFIEKEFSMEMISRFFQGITMSRCGVSEEEILNLLGTKLETVQLLLDLFSPLLHNSEGFYILKHNVFSNIIEKKFNLPINVRYELIKLLDQQKLTVRKIDELLYHLFHVKDWMRLKDFLIQLEVFAILFTPSFKLELYMYWVKLEQQHFDPVQEYNKSLENFVAQFSPGSKVFFMILIQFCRFFKDLAEVESVYTGKYRHPFFRGSYELREINVFDELETLTNVYSNNIETAGRDDDYCTSEGQQNIECVRARVLEDFGLTSKLPEFYYYKRWLWIQFPWFAIDANMNFSKSMKNFSYQSDNFSLADELKLFLNIIKLISCVRKNSIREVSRLTSITLASTPQMARSVSHSKLSRGLCVLPDLKIGNIMIQHIEDNSKFKNRSVLSQSLQIFMPERKDVVYTADITNAVPGNILFKLTSEFTEYTSKELLAQQKVTCELQKSYNKYKEIYTSKQKTLNSIASQISKSSVIIKKQQEVKEKVGEYEGKIEETFEKCLATEEAGKKLQKIINCCVKNPTRNDEWQRELEKILENMEVFIQQEEDQIKAYEQETLQIEEQCKILEMLKNDKSCAQNSTLYKANDTIQVNSRIRERINIRKKKRKLIYLNKGAQKIILGKKPSAQRYENLLQEFANTKNLAKLKLKGYKDMVDKLSIFRKFEHINSLYEIVTTFDRCYQLQDEISIKRKNIDEISREKEALELQLQYFQNKKLKELEKSSRFSSFESIHYAIFMKEKLFEDKFKATQSQEYILLKIQILVENCWKILKIDSALKNGNEGVKENLKKIIEKLMLYKAN